MFVDRSLKGATSTKLASLVAARKRAVGQKQLFDISLPRYEEMFRWAAGHLGLPANVIATPHTARRGGASAECAMDVRDLSAIRAHGRWGADRSVARYKEAGMF